MAHSLVSDVQLFDTLKSTIISNRNSVSEHIYLFIHTEIEDLRYVVRVLQPLENKWENIGTVLRVRNLDTIKKKFPTEPQRCLIAMLSDWLNGQYDTQRGKPPSWWMVVFALADRGGGDNRQRAEYVAKNHKGICVLILES